MSSPAMMIWKTQGCFWLPTMLEAVHMMVPKSMDVRGV
jgi:hypothetical protein